MVEPALNGIKLRSLSESSISSLELEVLFEKCNQRFERIGRLVLSVQLGPTN